MRENKLQGQLIGRWRGNRLIRFGGINRPKYWLQIWCGKVWTIWSDSQPEPSFLKIKEVERQIAQGAWGIHPDRMGACCARSGNAPDHPAQVINEPPKVINEPPAMPLAAAPSNEVKP